MMLEVFAESRQNLVFLVLTCVMVICRDDLIQYLMICFGHVVAPGLVFLPELRLVLFAHQV